MGYRKEGSAVCVMLCLVMVTANSHYFEKQFSFEKKHLIVAKESLVNTTFLYGVCDFDNGIKPNGSCDIIKETFNFDNTSNSVSCKVALKTRVVGDINLAQVGKNKAVLVAFDDSLEHSEKQHLHLMNVDLDSCQTIYTKIVAPPSEKNWTSSEIAVVPYENTYDIFFVHTHEFLDKTWKGTFDLEGNVVKEIKPWIEFPSMPYSVQLTTVKYQTAAGGFVLIHSGSEKMMAMLINENGKKTVKEWNLPEPSYYFLLFFDNNQTVSECMYIYKTHDVKCSVFGSQGIVKDEITLDVAPYYFTQVPDGYIVLYDKYIDLKKSSTELKLPSENSKLYLRRLDAEGRLVKELPLDTFVVYPEFDRFNTHVFKNDAGETCVSYINFNNHIHEHLLGNSNKLQVAGQCFADL